MPDSAAPFPDGHGTQPGSAVCLCGVLIHECEDMLRWGLRRSEQVKEAQRHGVCPLHGDGRHRNTASVPASSFKCACGYGYQGARRFA